jgi:hypothetical protein
MSLVDTTFSTIPASLLSDWGQNLTYLKTGSDSYSTSTGTVTSTDTSVTVRALISQANPEEFEGFYQTNDLKITIGAAELGDYYPNVRDRIQYSEAAVTKVGRIISVKTYRAESPILHILLVRPQ